MDYYPKLVIRDPVGPIKTKGRSKITTRIKSCIETSDENRQKRSCAYYEEQGHISTACAKCKIICNLCKMSRTEHLDCLYMFSFSYGM